MQDRVAPCPVQRFRFGVRSFEYSVLSIHYVALIDVRHCHWLLPRDPRETRARFDLPVDLGNRVLFRITRIHPRITRT